MNGVIDAGALADALAGALSSADPGTVALLAGISLAEGVRRVPDGATVLRRVMGGAWSASVVEADAPRWSLVSWWSPLSVTIVCAPWSGGALVSATVLAGRWRAIRWRARFLAALSALVQLALVIGLPVSMGALGGGGFVIGVAAILLLAIATMLVGWSALRGVGHTGRAALGQVLGWLSPFAAARAYEQVMEAAARDASPLAVAQWRLAPAAFAAFVRRRAWDAEHGAEDAEWTALADAATRRSFVEAAPPGLDATARSWCPRCGAAWRLESGDCPDCGVPLREVPSMEAVPQRG